VNNWSEAILTSRRNKAVALFSLLVLLLAGFPLTEPAEAQTCSKVNQLKVVAGVQYKCTKVGSRLQWVKQSSKAVTTASTPRPSPSPTRPVKLPAEESRCTKPAARVGVGAASLVCIKFNGSLAWIRQSRLDRPTAFEPCLRAGARTQVGGEFLVCNETFLGKLWDFESGPQESIRSYLFTSPGCHARLPDAWLEVSGIGTWSSVSAIEFIPAQGCPQGAPFSLVARATLESGQTVRMRILTKEWHWESMPAALSENTSVPLTSRGVTYFAKSRDVNWPFGGSRTVSLAKFSHISSTQNNSLEFKLSGVGGEELRSPRVQELRIDGLPIQVSESGAAGIDGFFVTFRSSLISNHNVRKVEVLLRPSFASFDTRWLTFDIVW